MKGQVAKESKVIVWLRRNVNDIITFILRGVCNGSISAHNLKMKVRFLPARPWG